MSRQRSFVRKIIYLVAIAALMLPLYWLSHPATGAPDAKGGVGATSGGVLAQIRKEHGLTEAQIGEIDPTSETIRLATLGMRGVAANILWEKANDYKMKKDWTNLAATLNQLIRLEPHFIAVWEHQGWNLSYNVSAEFDDYRERYRWVIKGIQFLQQGLHYNEHSPHLVWDVAWFVSHKIGRADESKQFRVLFKQDDEFHGSRPLQYRDNWLVGKEWFQRAEDLVAKGDSLRQKSPVLFYSDAGMCQMNYAEALEGDGIFQEVAKRAWVTASEDWRRYGDVDMPTTEGEKIHLNDREMYAGRAAEGKAKLEAIEPGLRKKLVEEARAKLTSRERRALDAAPEKRTMEEQQLAYRANEKIAVTPSQQARRIAGPRRDEALELAAQINEAEKMADLIDRHRQIVNFDFWRLHAQVEQTAEALAAREAVFNGDQLAKTDPLGAQEAFAKGCVKWRAVLDKFPGLDANEGMVQPINEMLERYVKILDQLDEVFPGDFALAGFVRGRVEQMPALREARTAVAEADNAAAKDDARVARKAFDRAFTHWRTALDKTPGLVLMSDRKTCAELMETVDRYTAVLEQLKETFPQDFPLLDFIRIQIQHADGAGEARQFLANGDKALADQKLAEAHKQYEQALAAWRKVLDKFPPLVQVCDPKTNEKLLKIVDRYRFTLKNLDQKFPEKFILQNVIDAAKGK